MNHTTSHTSVPPYLSEYRQIYQQNPHQAALSWFAEAQFGLFMHYGIYSLLGRGEWVMYREAIPLAEYEKQKYLFMAEKFDADFITDLALDAGMKYINITSRHHDSFCLFESQVSDYTSTHSPAKRDLVAELAEQCQRKGLGLFLYYSYALDWRYPYFYPRSIFPIARPDYPQPEPRYLWREDADFVHYIEFVHTQVKELLTNYGPIAGIWFDPIMGYYARPDLFPVDETYAMIRKLQPQTLIAFKQGANGKEDFASPERQGHSLADRVREQINPAAAIVAQNAWDRNKSKHNEICDTLQPGAWGYTKDDDGKHHTSVEVLQMLAEAKQQNCNLLLNTGPLADGSIHPEDVKTLREVGQHLSHS
jgi:alpha-L-fucosidase